MTDDPSPLDKTLIISPSSISPSHDPIPNLIGPYPVKGLLGKGATSLLYLGIEPSTNQLIALKVLSPKYMAHPEMIDLFLKEARLVEMANHPNIVKLYGHGKWEGGLYIAMEFVGGISLRKLIQQHVLSFRRSLEVILETAKALSHLHAHHIIHRDLKPDNILLTEDGTIKVIDFGIARLVGEKNDKQKQMMGTLSYMSPEQKENPLEVSFPSDIYSLAIIAYELCINRLSYGVVDLSLLPKGIRKILSKALEVDVSSRYTNIEEFIDDLSHYIGQTFEENEELLDLSLKELSEFYENTYITLTPKNPYFNSSLSIGKAMPKGILSSHFYCDYLAMNAERLALVVGWPEKKGVQGIFNNAVLKGSMQVLQEMIQNQNQPLHQNGEKIIKQLGQVIQNNSLSTYSLCLLIFSLIDNQLYYFSCGPSKLWIQHLSNHSCTLLDAPNIKLGQENVATLMHISCNYNVGDHLYLFSSSDELNLKETDYQKAIEKSYLLSGHQKSQAILNELKTHFGAHLPPSSFTVMTLQRKR